MKGPALCGKTAISTPLLLLLSFLLSACSESRPASYGLPDPPATPEPNGEPPRGHISYQPPFAPISFEFDGKPLPAEPADVTELIVCRQGSNGQACDATRINTGRKITEGGRPGPAREDIEQFDFHATSTLRMINGAKLAPYDTYSWSSPEVATDYPSEAECIAVEQDRWVERLDENQLESEHIIVCIKTSEGDLGYLLIVPDRKRKPVAFYVHSYVWVR